MSVCGKCKASFINPDIRIASCKACGLLFHATVECSMMTATELKCHSTKSATSMFFKCQDCVKNKKPAELHELKNLVDCLSAKVCDLSKEENLNPGNKLDSIINQIKELNLNFDTKVSEIRDEIKNDLRDFKTDIYSNFVNVNSFKESNKSFDYRLTDLNSKFNDKFESVDVELAELKNTIKMSSGTDSSKDLRMQAEFQLRMRNQNNIILHNILESNSVNDDRLKIIDSLKSFSLQTDLNNVKFLRLGTKTQNKNRSIKLFLKDRNDVREILKNWRKLPNGINANDDHTKLQRDEFNKLKKLTTEYNQKHNQDDQQTVIYGALGIPKIISKRIKSASQSTSNNL